MLFYPVKNHYQKQYLPLRGIIPNWVCRKLWTQIAIILLIIVTIPVVLLGVFLIDTSQKAVKKSVLNNHKEIVTRAAQEIKLFVKQPRDLLNTTAAMLGVVYPAPWKQETVLVELALNQLIFMRVSSGDLSGREIANSELGRGLKWDYPKDALEGIKRRKTYVSNVKILDNHIPYLTMAVPIKKMGKIVGVLIADVNLRGMWEIVDNIRLDKTGRAFLVSNGGTLIAHQDKKKVLRNENLKGQKDVQSVLAGRTGAIELEDKFREKWISSYAPIPGLGWGIVLRQKQDEAYLFSKVMKTQSWIIIILSELAAILVSILIAKVVVRPIKTLVSGVKRVADGDLDHKIVMRRHDEIGELIRSFNDMTEKLKRAKARERLSAIGEAASGIAHELKNSLVPIKSFVQLFPQKHRDKKFVDRFSKLVPDEIKRWEYMLKELSDFSSHFELRTVETDVKELINNVLEVMREKFIEKKINVKCDAQNDNFRIKADPQKLKQVFMNLIINAINAMPEGGLLIVSMNLINSKSFPSKAESSPAHIEVRVKDTGKGMSRDALEEIFEPFHTTKGGGMGLGLTISRRIVEQHGGSIDVESEIDVGTTFLVRLPVTQMGTP